MHKNGAIVKENLSESEMKYVNASYAHVTRITDFTEIKDDFIKITVHDPDANCPETREKLHEFFHQLYIVASEDTWMDISNIGIHKGTTVQELQRLLGVSADETMAFGDGRNDKELMEAASYSFAVKNAIDEIKDAAHFVIKSNEESSVMHTIMRILALQKQWWAKANAAGLTRERKSGLSSDFNSLLISRNMLKVNKTV